MAYLHGDLAVADAVLAVEGERANIERAYDELPSSGPSLRIYTYFRAALRFLRCLLFFRAAYFLSTVFRFSRTIVCFLRSILLCPSRFGAGTWYV